MNKHLFLAVVFATASIFFATVTITLHTFELHMLSTQQISFMKQQAKLDEAMIATIESQEKRIKQLEAKQ